MAAAALALGQAPSGGQFDVVSIKPSAPDAHNNFMIRSFPGGSLRMIGVPLRMMIMDAYGVKVFQVSGGPDWIRTARWDLEAKADGFEGRIPRTQEDAMMQAAMADRFQLRIHRETKRMPVYALRVDKNRPKLAPHTGQDHGIRSSYGSFTVKQGTVGSLADAISRDLGRVVIDRTGLKGDYDYTLQWTPEPGEGGPESIGLPPAPPEPHPTTNGPSLFTALREQLGLRLVAEKGPVQIIVIDSVAKPSEN
jgi:uncharacterized protein (TIGR03435 family)